LYLANNAGFQSAAVEKSHAVGQKFYGAPEFQSGAAEKSHAVGQKFYAAAEFQSATSIFQFFNSSIFQFFNFSTCGLRAGSHAG